MVPVALLLTLFCVCVGVGEGLGVGGWVGVELDFFLLATCYALLWRSQSASEPRDSDDAWAWNCYDK